MKILNGMHLQELYQQVKNIVAVLNNIGNEYIRSTRSNNETVEVGHISEGLRFRYNFINSEHLNVTTRSPTVGTYQEVDNTHRITTLAHYIAS
jgi:hypothetical protein